MSMKKDSEFFKVYYCQLYFKYQSLYLTESNAVHYVNEEGF